MEAAVMLPFLIIVTFGAIDISQYINSGQMISNASREGARVAARNDTKTVAEVKEAVMAYLSDVMPQLDDQEWAEAVQISVQTVNISYEDNDDGSESRVVGYGTIPGGDMTTIDSGDAISITVDFDFDVVRWLKGPVYAQHSIRTVCRRE